jgi:N-acetylmuramoyl-L-alanine amidase
MVIAQMYEEEGDLQQAYLEYLRVTVNYPSGDQVRGAKKKLDKLERKLSPILAAKQDEKESEQPASNSSAGSDDQSLAGVEELRHWSTRTYTRVVLTLERAVPYTANLLKKDREAGKPRRLYLDLRGARLTPAVKDATPIDDGLLARARAGQFTPNTVRLVLDIKHLESYKVFTLDNPFRVVIDCFGPTDGAVARRPGSRKPLSIKGKTRLPRGRAKDAPPDVGLAAALGLKIRRVVLDPGHGGKDPGAVYKGVMEKNLTLDLARRVAPLLKKQLGCQVLLTRDKDVFPPLEARTAMANTQEADLFVSIHVNAAPSRRLSGVETYFLNLATDEESMRVAARENATTTRSISDLQVILNDLMLNSKVNESNRLARAVQKGMLSSLRKKYRVRDLKVKQAPFYVLIGARMPAILVEVGFITNPTEHKRLKSSRYRSLVAEGIANGIVEYARKLNVGG